MEYYTKTEVGKILGLTPSGFWRVAEECEFTPAIQKGKNTALFTKEQVEEIKAVYALKRKGIPPKICKKLVSKGLDRNVWLFKKYKTAKVIENNDELIQELSSKGVHELEYINLKECVLTFNFQVVIEV